MNRSRQKSKRYCLIKGQEENECISTVCVCCVSVYWVHRKCLITISWLRSSRKPFIFSYMMYKRNFFSEDTEDFPKEIEEESDKKNYYFGIVPEFALLGFDVVSSISKPLHKSGTL